MRRDLEPAPSPFVSVDGELKNYGDNVLLEGPGCTATVAFSAPGVYAGAALRISVLCGATEGEYVAAFVGPVPPGGYRFSVPIYAAWGAIRLELYNPGGGPVLPIVGQKVSASIIGWTGRSASGSGQG